MPLAGYGAGVRQLNATLSQAALLLAGVLLSVDVLNPVKLVAGVLGVPSYWGMYPFGAMLIHLVVSQFSDLAYFAVSVFFLSIVSIFFTKVEVIGHSNVPREGPIIFTGNHANQFVDALMCWFVQVMSHCGHKVGFLIATKSWNRPIIGFFSRAMGCIPVMRPQDAAEKRPPTETVTVKGRIITGTNTAFIKLFGDGDKIRLRGKPDQLKIREVLSDTLLELVEDVPEDYEVVDSKFDVLKYVDQSAVFDYVHQGLAKGQTIGLFPEGGSHDRTDLLPLKAGVAIIAFGALEKHGVSVPVVPIGLNYYRGHRFRARAVVEFGAPIHISEELFELYKVDKRAAYTQLLMQIEDGMRGCLVTAPDYESLRLVYTARRLFQPNNRIPTPVEKQDMNRRFAEGYKILSQAYEEKKEMPGIQYSEATKLKERLESYQRKLSELGLRDYQVPTLGSPAPLKATYKLVHLFFVMLLASVPSLILNAPVGIVARILAAKERKRALAGSVVKIAARDVMMSKKIMISIVMVPTLWLTYGVALMLLVDWKASTKVLVLLSMPVFSYMGVMATEAGMVDAKDLKPIFMRLLPSKRREMKQLPAVRMELQRNLRAFVAKVGPSLGPIYTDPDLKWGALFRGQKEEKAKLESMADTAAQVMNSSESAAAQAAADAPADPASGAPDVKKTN